MLTKVLPLLLVFAVFADLDSLKTNKPLKFYSKNGNIICLVMEFNLNIAIPFINEKNEIDRKIFDIHDLSPTSEGSCERPETLNLTLYPIGQPSMHLNFTFNYTSDGTILNRNETYASRISFDYNTSIFPNSKKLNVSVATDKHYFQVPKDYFFSCNSIETIVLDPKAHNVTLLFGQLRVNSFRESRSKDFLGQPDPCIQDTRQSSIVPVIVGVILSIMIIVSLVLFFMGVKRRAPNYEQL